MSVGARLRGVVLVTAVLASAPIALTAQEAHAGAHGSVYETNVLERTGDGVIRLGNGAAVLATAALAGARAGAVAVVVPLRSGCRIWIERIGLSRCALVEDLPENAPTTGAVLVWVDRVIDGGATVLLTGGSVFRVERDQTELTNLWSAGEAILIGDSRLLHLDHGQEIVRVAGVR